MIHSGFLKPAVIHFQVLQFEAEIKSLLFVSGSEEGAEKVKQTLLKEVGKVTDIVSSLGFSWWQGGPPHTQTLKDLHWVSRQQINADVSHF